MDGPGLVALVARECALFAAAGILIGGLDDLCVDLGWAVHQLRRRLAYLRHARATAAMLTPAAPGLIAIFVPAWREDAVIGAMVAAARAGIVHSDWRLYVGTYPNDPASLAAARAGAGGDPRIRLVVGDQPGPTTKAGCLNWLWAALCEDERRDGRRAKAVVLHDAEDLIHPDELAVHDALIERFAMVQIPVEPVPVAGCGGWARFVSTIYASEFAEAHGKEMVVREWSGAALPSAGVGCAVARPVLARLAEGRDGPFDGGSVTEDYELGLAIGARGGRTILARVRAADGLGWVATRACFPHGVRASVRQKARWIAGIALAGWDRLGWTGGVTERWMRVRDRRAPLAALVLSAAYLGLVFWCAAAAAACFGGASPGRLLPPALVRINSLLLGWRVLVRAAFVAPRLGWRGVLATPAHMLVANLIAILAAGQALMLYADALHTGRVRWTKTAHVFPR